MYNKKSSNAASSYINGLFTETGPKSQQAKVGDQPSSSTKSSQKTTGEDPVTPKKPLKGSEAWNQQKKKSKNYNYVEAEQKELEDNPIATGKLPEYRQKEIESSLEPKRREFIEQYKSGKLKRGALRDSIQSTLRTNSKAKDFMPPKPGKPEPPPIKMQDVEWWIGDPSVNGWQVRYKTPNVFDYVARKTKRIFTGK